MSQTGTTWLAGLIGPQTTRLCHVERVAETARALAWVDAPTRPSNLADGLLAAFDELAAITGSRYLDDEQRLMPVNARGRGCDGMALCVAALPPLRILIAGLTDALSVAAARQAIQQTLAAEVGVLTPARFSQPRQVTRLLEQTRPDLVLLVGGVEGGPVQPLQQLARLLVLGIARLPEGILPTLLYAGNEQARTAVRQVLPAQLSRRWLPNVLPESHIMQREPLATLCRELYQQQMASQAGFQRLIQWAGRENVLGPDETACRLLRFWLAHYRLHNVSGAWWLGDRLMILHSADGGRHFACRWDNSSFAGSNGHYVERKRGRRGRTSPLFQRGSADLDVPEILAERSVPAAVWTAEADHGRFAPFLRSIRFGGKQRQPRAGHPQAMLWLDDAGLSLALAALAACSAEAAAQALLLDGLHHIRQDWQSSTRRIGINA